MNVAQLIKFLQGYLQPSEPELNMEVLVSAFGAFVGANYPEEKDTLWFVEITNNAVDEFRELKRTPEIIH